MQSIMSRSIAMVAIARVAAADPAPSQSYAALAGTVTFDAGAVVAAGGEVGYQLGDRQLLVHALVAEGYFQPLHPNMGVPEGSYFEARAGLETDACSRPSLCIVVGADLGYERKHARDITAGPTYAHAAVAVGRLGLVIAVDRIRLAAELDLRGGISRGFSGGEATGAGVTGSAGIRF